MFRSRTVALLLLPALLASCSPAQPLVPAAVSVAPAVTPGAYVRGRAFYGAPVAGGTVRFYERGGTLLLEATERTHSTGTFSFFAPQLVGKNLRVEVSGGTVNGKLFAGKVEAVFDAFDPRMQTAYCNAATSFATALLQTRGGTATEANRLARAYFGLPAKMSLGSGVDNPQQHLLEESKLIAAAEAAGSFNALVAARAAQIDKGATAEFHGAAGYHTLQFTPTGLAMDLLAKPLASALIGAGVGAALGKLGLDPAANARKEILGQLSAVSGKIDQLSAAVSGVSQQVTAVQDSLNELSRQVSANAWNQARQDAVTAYTNGTDNLATPSAYVSAAWDAYNQMIDAGDNLSKQDLDYFKADYSPETLVQHLGTIGGLAGGTAGGQSLIQRWQRVAAFTEQAAGGNYPNRVGQRYFQNCSSAPAELIGLQLQGTLLADALYYLRQSGTLPSGTVPDTLPVPAGTTTAWNNYSARSQAQASQLWYTQLPADSYDKVVGSPLGGVLWSKAPWKAPNSVAILPLFRSLTPQTTTGFSYFNSNRLAPDPGTVAIPATGADGQPGWRLPTGDELNALGSSVDDHSVNALKASGFDFGFIPVSNDQTWLGAATIAMYGQRPAGSGIDWVLNLSGSNNPIGDTSDTFGLSDGEIAAVTYFGVRPVAKDPNATTMPAL